MVARDARGAKRTELFSRENAVRGAEVDSEFLAHGTVAVERGVELLARERPARGHDGEAVDARLLVGACVGDDLFLCEKCVFLDARPVVRGLGAVLAVLAAVTAARVDDRTEVDVLAAELPLQLVCALLQRFKRRIEEDGEVVLALDAAAAENFFREFFDGVFLCHGRASFLSRSLHFLSLYFRRRI